MLRLLPWKVLGASQGLFLHFLLHHHHRQKQQRELRQIFHLLLQHMQKFQDAQRECSNLQCYLKE